MAGCIFKRKIITRKTIVQVLLMIQSASLFCSPVFAFLPKLFCVFDDSGGKEVTKKLKGSLFVRYNLEAGIVMRPVLMVYWGDDGIEKYMQKRGIHLS